MVISRSNVFLEGVSPPLRFLIYFSGLTQKKYILKIPYLLLPNMCVSKDP